MVLSLWKVSCEEQAIGGYEHCYRRADSRRRGRSPGAVSVLRIQRGGWHRHYPREEPRCEKVRALAGEQGCVIIEFIASTLKLVNVGIGRLEHTTKALDCCAQSGAEPPGSLDTRQYRCNHSQ